jgi:hypothetical protein
VDRSSRRRRRCIAGHGNREEQPAQPSGELAAADGHLVASLELPASLHAGPITYRLREGVKQYLVVAPGGHSELGRMERSSKLGDWIIAYTLPDLAHPEKSSP